MSVVEQPPNPSGRRVFYGSRQDLHIQPDLSMCAVMESVLLNRNNLYVLYREFLPPSIKHLNLSYNYITADGILPEWPNSLESITLETNNITDLDFTHHWPTHLKDLALDDNPLRQLSNLLPESLELLSVSYCHLQELSSLPQRLKTLRAYYNKLRSICKLPQTLTYCNLSHNLLTSSTMFRHPLPSGLLYLNLEGNQLTTLPKNLPDSIETLLLANNKLTEIPENLPQNLQHVSFCNNKILTIKFKSKLGQRIRKFYVRNNCITENLSSKYSTAVDTVYQSDNWNQEIHKVQVTRIQQLYKRYKLKQSLRIRARMRKYREELFEIAYHPDFVHRWNEIETWSQWKH